MNKFKYGSIKPDKIIYADKEVDYHREVDSVIEVQRHALSVTIVNGTCEAPTSILETETITLTIIPNEHYLLPETVTVVGATYDYDNTTGIVTITNATNSVSVEATCLGTPYSITATITGGTATGDEVIRFGSTAAVTIVPNENYLLPEDITVTGAQYAYNDETGVVSLSEPTSNVTIEATCPMGATILGVSGEGRSDGVLTRTDQAIGLSFSINSSTGAIASDFDNVFPYKDITEVTDTSGNVFVRIPKHYTKYTYDSDTGQMTTRISNVQLDGYILNPCFHDDAGNETDYVCVGKYTAGGDSSLAISKTNEAPLVNITHATMRTACTANGTNYGMLDYWTWRMLQDLFKIEFATTDSQIIMRGRVDTNSASNTGTCDAIGVNKSGWDLTSMCMTYRGIENLYGNIFQWCDGMLFDNHKILVCYDPTKYSSNVSSTDYVEVGYKINENSSAGYPVSRGYDSDNPIVWESLDTTGGSASKYWFDYCMGGTSPCPGVGGRWNDGTGAGLWCMYAYSAGSAAPSVGGRLIYRGSPA